MSGRAAVAATPPPQMAFEPEKHHRRSIRLRGYDYARPGEYFVTVCTAGKEKLFGEVVEGEMVLKEVGKMVQGAWKQMPRRFSSIELDEFVVMPNHFHAIVRIRGAREKAEVAHVGAPLAGAQKRAGARPAPTEGSKGAAKRAAPTVGDVIGAFKSVTTDESIRGDRESGWRRIRGKLWQRNYYEHIIRGRRELDIIREYIRTNPVRWSTDPENPDFIQEM